MKKYRIILLLFMILIIKFGVLDVNAEVKSIEVGSIISGEHNAQEEYSFEFAVTQAGKLTINFYSESDVTSGSFSWELTQNYSGATSWDSINGRFNYSLPVYVEQGVYILSVKCNWAGTYKVETIFEPATESFKENQTGGDNTSANANIINLKSTYYGLIMNEDVDVYKFNILEEGNYFIDTIGYASSGWLKYIIYDDNLNEVYNEDLGHFDKAYGGSGKYNKKYSFNAGNYYVAISSMGSFLGGPYSFIISKEEILEPIPEVPSSPDNPKFEEPSNSTANESNKNETESNSSELNNQIKNENDSLPEENESESNSIEINNQINKSENDKPKENLEQKKLNIILSSVILLVLLLSTIFITRYIIRKKLIKG